VLGNKFVRLLIKIPLPFPSKVLLLEIFGLGEVLQQTPLSVTVAPPSDVTFPPLVAVVWVVLEIEEVVTVGIVEVLLASLKQRTEIP
jgi:hypothetical protein